MTMPPLDPHMLPQGVRSRFIDGVNGLRMHLLEAGDPAAPCVLLLHGFPEIAYSWRKILPRLAEAGYHAVAPDLRGYGRTATRVTAFDEDLAPYRMTNRLLDALSLLSALGRRQAALVGHDYGSWIAGFCALARPDVFASLTLMSAPFAGAPSLAELPASLRPPIDDPIHTALAALSRPRKHYHVYYATPSAAADMDGPEHRVAGFLRAYYHHKSADWPGNAPHTLPGWTAEALAEMPTYYIMDHDRTMPETVAPETPADEGAACPWLTPAEHLRRGVRPHRLPGRVAGLPRPHGRQPGPRSRPLRRPPRRGAGAIHLRPTRLGTLPGSGRPDTHADRVLPLDGGVPPAGRRRPLGATGAAGPGCRVADRIPAPSPTPVLTTRPSLP